MWEVLADKKLRHTFPRKIAFLFRELPDYTKDDETELDLCKLVIIKYAAANCGCKRVGGQMGSGKNTAW